MMVATKRIRKHASAIPYFLIAILLSHPVWPPGACLAGNGSMVEKELFVPSLPEADSRGDSNTAGLRSGQCIRHLTRSGRDSPSFPNVRNFLWYSKTPSTTEFASYI